MTRRKNSNYLFGCQYVCTFNIPMDNTLFMKINQALQHLIYTYIIIDWWNLNPQPLAINYNYKNKPEQCKQPPAILEKAQIYLA